MELRHSPILHIRNVKRPLFSLNIKMMLLISTLIILILMILGFFMNLFISKTIEDQMGKRALSVATSVANMEDIVSAFDLENPASRIQGIVDPIQKETNAEYIVVGNKDGIRYSHPIQDRIGKEMVGGDNDRALYDGESYVTKQTGSLGLSIRGKVPIKSKNGEIIGVVSVGFLNDDIQAIINEQRHSIWLMISLFFLLGIIGAIGISRYIKRLLFHMEPEEISELLLQKEAILQSTKEGIIAINHRGETTMINKAALNIIQSKESSNRQTLIENHVNEKAYMHIFDHIKENDHNVDMEMMIENTIVIVSRTAITENQTFLGAVATIRKKTEIEHLTKELSQIKQYANALRSQSHEFSNKLYTILGLLQLNKVDKAEQFIKAESNIQSNWLTFLTDHMADPYVHGLLQGKWNQANELDISLQIQDDSMLTNPLTEDKQEALLTSLGNIIENAIDSIKLSCSLHREISIFFSDHGQDIIFEIEDSGPGILEEKVVYLFEQGFSTKGTSGRGTGLALSKKVINDVGGEIIYEPSELGGALFVIVIPKNGGQR
ncbi:ATP-binding protein [Pseudogracilibacillus auburnensis]|uniref:ATP-binding protein n=1 Tax=Pseudogracilibacillus auburnensis TaxID=1494959 RepID=UPI001F6216FD|nr:sensor histidine kinase [Pseudogracilibacillus auburnensis]